MIIDMRGYTYVPAQFAGFVKAYVHSGHAIVARHLGYMAGVFISSSGTANRTLQLFAYEDHDHRDECRRRLRADPAWLDFIREAAPAISVQENTIIRPTSISPATTVLNLRDLASGTLADDRLFQLRARQFQPGQASGFLTDAGRRELRLRADAGEQVLAQFVADTGAGDRTYTFTAFRNAVERDRVNQVLAGDAVMTPVLEALYPRLVGEACDLWQPLACSPLR